MSTNQPNEQEKKCLNCPIISTFVEFNNYFHAHLCPQCEWNLNDDMNYDGEG